MIVVVVADYVENIFSLFAVSNLFLIIVLATGVIILSTIDIILDKQYFAVCSH